MRKILLLYFIILTSSIFAQKVPQIDWERTFGSRGKDVTHDVIQTSSGDVVIVGETSTNDGKDGLLVILSSKGTSILETLITGEGDEIAKAIVDLGNGEFVIAGSTEMASGKYGWLVKVNFQGDILWQKQYGKSNESEFNDMVLTSKGTFVMAGTSKTDDGNDVWLIEVDSEGGELWSQTYGGDKDDGGRSLIMTNDGGYAVAGYTNSKGNGKTDMYLVKTNSTGDLEWDNAYGFKKWEEAFGVQPTDDDGFMLGGFNSYDKRNSWVVRVDKRGNMRWQKEYGGGDFDEAHTLMRTYDGNYVIGGATRSHKNGARYTKMWLMRIDENGKELMDNGFYGGKRNDDAQSMVQTSDGNFVVVGSTGSSGMGGADLWVVKLTTGDQPKRLNPSTIDVIFLGFEDNNGNETLEAGEKGVLKVQVKNTGSEDSYNLEGDVAASKRIKGLHLPDKMSVGFLKAGQSTTLLMPVEANEKIPTDKISLRVKFTDKNKSSIQPISYRLAIEAAPQVDLTVTGFRLNAVTAGEAGTFRVVLENNGKKAAEGYSLNFIAPSALIATSSNGLKIPTLGYEDDFEGVYNFEISKNYEYNTLPITCVITSPEGDTSQYIVKLEVKKPKEPIAEVVTAVRWFAPDIDFYREKPLKLRNERLFIKLKIESNQTYKREDIQVLINGKPYKAGSKFDEGRLISTGKNRQKLNVFTYLDTIAFENDGDYTVSLQSKKDGEIISEVLKVAYSSKKPNLYVLSVGTKTNLEYTMQDAKDFAELYKEQAGERQLFNSIEVETILGEEATATNILSAIEDFDIKYRTDEITPNDMIIIFMSSHGFMIRDEFYIQGDDYQTGRHRTKAIRYSEMTEILEAIPCKKLIFIDACHSGGAKGVSSFAINNAIRELNEQKAGTTTIVSSAADELSYEDKAWKNGAFTEAIIKGLKDGACDKDANSVVSIQELFSFIKKEVPELVDKIKSQPQNPQMVSTGLNNVPIYILR